MKSDLLKYNFFYLIVFIEICSENCETVYLALRESGVTKKSQLIVNESYRFSNFKKSLWRSNEVRKGDKEIYWFIGDGDCEIAPAKRKAMSSSSTAIYDVDSTISLIEVESKMKRSKGFIIEMGQPISPYLRSILAGREMIIEGVVHKLHPLGWLEISLSSPISFLGEVSIVTGKKSEVDVFLVHRRRSSTIDDLQNGTEVKVSFVFPIFLWGTLSGFAATVRSQIEIVKRAQYSPSSSSRKGGRSNTAINCSNSSYSRKDGGGGSGDNREKLKRQLDQADERENNGRSSSSSVPGRQQAGGLVEPPIVALQPLHSSDNTHHRQNCQKVSSCEKKSRNGSSTVPFQVPVDIRYTCI
jgi:hypothetical protein